MSCGLELAGALGSTALVGFGVLPLLHRELSPEVWFDVHWPREIKPGDAVSLLRQLAAQPRPTVIVFEARASRSGVTHHLGIAGRDAKDLARTITSLLPGTLLEPADESVREAIVLTRAVELRLTTRERSLRRDAPDEVARSLATALAGIGNGTVVMQWLIGPRLTPIHVGRRSTGLPSTPQLVRDALLGRFEPLDAACTDRAARQGRRPRFPCHVPHGDFDLRSCKRRASSSTSRGRAPRRRGSRRTLPRTGNEGCACNESSTAPPMGHGDQRG